MSSITRWQPVLPAEQPPNKAERAFINDQPAIFPPNQDSNWGVLRKAWTDQLQALIDQQTLIWAERFVQTSTTFLDEWEFMAGLPENSTGVSDSDRRLRILNRLRSGPFTDARIIDIIEPYIQATFGVSPAFTPGGLSLSGGIPLKADATGDPKQYYRVYEDIRNFAYAVWIASVMTPDTTNMLRDLKRITPAGITVTIDNSHSQILDYGRTIKNSQPALWWRMTAADGVDSSGNGFTGTWAGSPATVASPGLLNASIGGLDGAITLDGVDDYVFVGNDVRLHPQRLAMEVIYKPNALPGAGNSDVIMAESTWDVIGIDGNNGNKFYAGASVGGVQKKVLGPVAVVGTKYQLASQYTGSEIRLWVNGVMYSASAGGPRDITLGGIYVGRAQPGGFFAAGVVDEASLYEQLSDDEIIRHWKTANNVLL